jgi:hypothetical protein
MGEGERVKAEPRTRLPPLYGLNIKKHRCRMAPIVSAMATLSTFCCCLSILRISAVVRINGLYTSTSIFTYVFAVVREQHKRLMRILQNAHRSFML